MKLIKIQASRFDPEKDKEPHFETYEIEYRKEMRILDALRFIQQNIDGTLAFRWNCSMGICGSCAMEVNGVPLLTCKTELKPNIFFPIKISPLKAFPTIKDLVPDYSQVYEREKKLYPFFVNDQAKGFLTIKPDEIKDVRKFRSCIECFICNDNCKPYRESRVNFLGPKSIVKAMAYQLHPQDKLDRKKLLETEGLWNCAVTRCCQNSCPQDIPITDTGIIPTLEKKEKKRPNENTIKEL